MEQNQKLVRIPLEEALTLAGAGVYTHYVMLVTGLVVFAALLGMQVMSIVIPAASCDLGLSALQKGVLTSMAFTGMIFSSHLFGLLADTLGRRKVMLASNLLTIIVTIVSSLAPNAQVLMVFTFINGFLLGGVFTPAYVYVSEFCPIAIRTRGLLVCSALSALATVYLPCIAWLIMPLDVRFPLFGGLVFTSWRLYLALLAIPNLITNILLQRLPETPKFTLNLGKQEETLETLKTIYAINMRKAKDEFPVQSVVLDNADQDLPQKTSDEGNNACSKYLKLMINQTITLFTPPFLLYTIISCAILLVVVGTYNTVVLWIPEHTRQLMLYANSNTHYNATLCNVMGSILILNDEDQLCDINYEIFTTSIIIGSLQFIFFCIVSLISHRIKGRILIVIFSTLTAGASFTLIFAQSFMLTVSSLGAIVVLLLTIFPICLSIVVDFFPTSLRSTATSITMLFGRIGAAVGSQVIGALFQTYCEAAYWAMTSILIGVVILFLFMPTKRK